MVFGSASIESAPASAITAKIATANRLDTFASFSWANT